MLRFLDPVSIFCVDFFEGTISILRQQKDWVDGLGKCSFLLTSSTVSRAVGRSENLGGVARSNMFRIKHSMHQRSLEARDAY